MIILSGQSLPALSNPGAAGDLKNGKQLIDANGNVLTGTMPNITLPSPGITVSTGGLITASYSQDAGYSAGGSKSATKQLTTQAGTTITPGTSQKTAVASGRYTTGNVYVAGDSDLKASNIKDGVTIFGVTGSYGQGLSETIIMSIGDGWASDLYPYSSSGSYYIYRIPYSNNGTFPANPSSGEGKWMLASFSLILGGNSNILVWSGSAWGDIGGKYIGTSIGAYGIGFNNMSDSSTTYTQYCEIQVYKSTIQTELGSSNGAISIYGGSHLVFSSSVIWPEND